MSRGTLGNRRFGATIAAIACAATTLLIAGSPARAATPTVNEFSSGLPESARIIGITAASDGKLWFADDGDDTAGSINPFNQIISEIASAGLDGIAGVTNGPDGNVYYGRTGPPNSVGGIIPATGFIGNTYLGGGPTSQFYPYVPATGPDGQIWVTDPRDASTATADSVGFATPRVSASGGPLFQGAASLTGNADPQAIAAGPADTSNTPSEALWVAEFTANKIARLTPLASSGGPVTDVQEYQGLSTGAHPTGITLGPDGNIWFSEFDAGKVGRLIPPSTFGGSPTIDEFALPTAGSHPWGIAAGPDGNLWIAESSTGKVARMTTSGVVTGEYPTQNGSPFFITAGADGNMWFTEGSENSIGRITTGLDPPEFHNTAPIAVPNGGDSGIASPYPSTIDVSGLQGNITKVTVRVTGISHTFPDDLDLLLQGPQGQNVMLMSDAGSPGGSTSYSADGITLTFDQSAARLVSDKDPLVSGIYRPTNNAPGTGATQEFPSSPASPPPPYGNSLDTFNGSDPTGTWKLFVLDDNTESAPNTNIGKIYGGWGLDISTTGQISVGKSGSGTGTVTSAPAGIDCGGTCSSSFDSGTSVVLTAAPSSGSKFTQWQGCDSVAGNQCTVGIDSALTNVTAGFDLIPPPTQPVTPAPTVTPTVKKKCKKAKKRSAAIAKKCKKKKKA
jgi:streptogramin lyase/subtilisin-like proprotein convertase family protein